MSEHYSNIDEAQFFGRNSRTLPYFIFSRWKKVLDGYEKEFFESDFFKLYLYVDSDKVNVLADCDFVTSISTDDFVTIDKRVVKKAFFTRPEDVYKIREFCAERQIVCYEDDVKALKRFIIDNDVDYSLVQRILYIDIETAYSLDCLNTPQQILCVSTFDSFSKKFLTFAWRERIDDSNDSQHIRIFATEVEMLKSFFLYCKELLPDVYSGWNCLRFDLPYIVNRASKLKIVECDFLSPRASVVSNNRKYHGYYIDAFGKMIFNNVKVKYDFHDKTQLQVIIYCSSVFDLLAAYKRIIYENKAPGFSLGVVSEHVLQDKKVVINDIVKTWQNDFDNFVAYSLKDVELCVRIDEKCFLTRAVFDIQQVIAAPLNDLQSFGSIADYYILHEAKKRNIVLPSAKFIDTPSYEGAITGRLIFDIDGHVQDLPPLAGIYNNIACFDFSAMYSSIMLQFNLAFETLVEDTVVSNDLIIFVNEHKFLKKPRGFVPSILERLSAERSRLEQEMHVVDVSSDAWDNLKNLSSAYKTIANTLYGALGWSKFRLNKIAVAESITWFGRELIINVVKELNKINYESIYSDTDSVFVKLHSGDIEFELERLHHFLILVLQDFTKSRFNLDNEYLKIGCDKVFSKLLMFDVKKKYIGVLSMKKGKVTNELFGRGIELVKRDVPGVFREIVRDFSLLILSDANDKELIEFLTSAKKRIASCSHWQLAFSKRISQHLNEYKILPQHIKAAAYSNEYLNTSFSRNDYAKIVFVKNRNADVIALQDEFTINIDNMFDYPLDIERFFTVFIYNKIKLFDVIPGRDLSFLYTKSKDRKLAEF